MKNTILALLVAILVVAVVNLLIGLGIFGGSSSSGGGDYEYQMFSPVQMDNIGFTSVAKEEGIEIKEGGEINFPREMADKIMKQNLVPRTIKEIENDGGWQFIAVTKDDFYLFRR